VTCARCDYSTYEEKVALGHSEIKHDAKAPTCTEIGYEAYETCSRCDHSTYVEIPENGHTMGEWTVVDEPTCLEAGVKSRECTVCHHVETESVKELGHEIIVHEGKKVTCTEGGWDSYETCSRCDHNTFESKDALGHSYDYSYEENCFVCKNCEDTNLLGDVNGDGEITNLDVLEIFRYIYNSEMYPLPDIEFADVDGDGIVTNGDVLEIYRYIYNPTLYPIVKKNTANS
jgi:hypothetical protein